MERGKLGKMNPADRRNRRSGDPDSVLGGQLRQLRIDAGLSQEELAQAVPHLGWNGATVAKIESGSRSLKATELLVLLDEGLVAIPSQSGAGVHSWEVAEAYQWIAATRKVFDAERRAAERLGVTPEEVDDFADRLWGHDFRSERTVRLQLRQEDGLASGRGAAGRVSRAMVDDLRRALERNDGRQ
jgi:transcriptional regulator with XRE-family HTH domain